MIDPFCIRNVENPLPMQKYCFVSTKGVSMPSELSLLRGHITLDQALDEDDNVLAQIGYPRQRQAFWRYLSEQSTEIEAIVSFHLGVNGCRAGDEGTWLSGSFNVCVPVYISPPSEVRTVFVRVPLPYKVGERNCPGNVDEKLRCEVASYIWIQQNCPDIPIPPLFGFGFPNGQRVSLMFPSSANSS